MSLLGIDLGTTGVRAAAYDLNGSLLAEHSLPVEVFRPAESLVVTDADAVLTAAFEAARRVVSSKAVLNDRVLALSFSVQGEAVVPVDGEGRATALAPVSMDRRGTHAASLLGDRFGHAAFQEVTGQPLHPMFSIFKIAAGHEGWTGDGVAGYRTLDAFVAAGFGARATADYSMAARSGVFDVANRDWSDDLLAVASDIAGFAVSRENLPAVAAPGTVIGAVSETAAAQSGLLAGTPIVAGMHDQAASFLGAGGSLDGASVFALGSSDCLTVATDRRPARLGGTGFASYPIADELWLTLAGTAAGGWALEWFAALVGDPVADLFGDVDPHPSSLIVLPYLAGSGTLDNDPAARGIIAGLTLATGKSELARGFIESAGYELAKIVHAFESRGVRVGDVRAVGSGAKNVPALRVRASAAGRPMHPVPGEASSRGAALLAGIGIGAFDGFAGLPAVAAPVRVDPDADSAEWYRQQRTNFTELYALTSRTIHTLTHNKEHFS